MKKFRHIFIALTVAVLVAAAVGFTVACNPVSPEVDEPVAVTVTFRDGAAVLGKRDVMSGDPFEAVENPSRPNHIFEGWSLTEGGEVVQLPAVYPKQNTTYYAVFSRRYRITLNAGNYGTLPQADRVVDVTAGENIYEKVKDIVPEADDDAVFDGWYMGNTKLTEGSVASVTGDVTLRAEYSVDYIITVNLQNEYGEDAYTADAELTKKVSGSARVGTYVNVADLDAAVLADKTEYIRSSKQDEGMSIDVTPLATDKSLNVFNIYYDIKSYQILFSANLPEDIKNPGVMEPVTVGHNVEYDVPSCGYAATGYRFLGWKTSNDPDAEIVYRRNTEEKIKTTATMTLYAVWAKGLTDVNGMSSDYIYITDSDDGKSTVAFLERSGLPEKAGTYDAQNHTFKFENGGKVELQGYVDLQAETFMYAALGTTYYFNDRKGVRTTGTTDDGTEYDYVNIENTVDKAVTLVINNDGTAVYTDKDAEPVRGRYEYDAESGSMSLVHNGENKFNFRLATRQTEEGLVDVFEKRDEDVYGVWYQYGYTYTDRDGYSMSIDNTYMSHMMLDGYGGLRLYKFGYQNMNRDFLNRTNTSYAVIASAAGYYAVEAPKDEVGVASILVSVYNNAGTIRTVSVKLVETEENYGTEKAPIHKLYAEYSGAYAMPVVPADEVEVTIKTEADYKAYAETATARLVLDGYGLLNDSATYTYTDTDGTKKTVTGKYVVNNGLGELTIFSYNETNKNYDKTLIYLLSAVVDREIKDGEGNVTETQKVVAPFFETAVSFSQKYNLIVTQRSQSGASYEIAFNMRLIDNGDSAAFALVNVAERDSFFGIYSYSPDYAIFFQGSVEKIADNGGGKDDIYEFTNSEESFSDDLLYAAYYSLYITSGGSQMSIGGLENFRYYKGTLPVNTDAETMSMIMGFKITGVYDGMADRNVDGFVLDGWGNAVKTGEDGSKDERTYSVISGGLDIIAITKVTGTGESAVVDNMYYVVTEESEGVYEYRAWQKDENGAFPGRYVAANTGGSIVLVMLENNEAALGYFNSNGNLCIYSLGKISGNGDIKTYTEFYNAPELDLGILGHYVKFSGGETSFTFGVISDSTGVQINGQMYIYPDTAEAISNGKGDTLIIDYVANKATVTKSDGTSYEGSYAFLCNNVLQIVIGSGNSAVAHTIELSVGENGKFDSFVEVKHLVGTFENAETGDILVLTATETGATRDVEVQKQNDKGEVVNETVQATLYEGIYKKYDSETKSHTDYDVTYYLIPNRTNEFMLIYKPDATTDEKTVRLRAGLSANRLPVFEVCKFEELAATVVYTRTYFNYVGIGILHGDGYSAQQFQVMYPNAIASTGAHTGKAVFYDDKPYFKFDVDDSDNDFYFEFMNRVNSEGEQETVLVLLDGTFFGDNFGVYEIEENRQFYVNDGENDVKIVKLMFTGYGLVGFVPASAVNENGDIDTEKCITGVYNRLSSGSYTLYTVRTENSKLYIDELVARVVLAYSNDQKNDTVTWYALVSDSNIDSVFGRVFVGEGFTALQFSGIENGYGGGIYIDKNGIVYSTTYVRVGDPAEYVMAIAYRTELNESYVFYVKLDMENMTYEVVPKPETSGGENVGNEVNNAEIQALVA